MQVITLSQTLLQRKYDLKFTQTKEPQTETENIEYAGTMHLASKNDSVDTGINVFGRCSC